MAKKFEKHGFILSCRDYISNREFDIIVRKLKELQIDLTSGMDASQMLDLFSNIDAAVSSFILKVEDSEFKELPKDIAELPADLTFQAKMYLFECFKSFAEGLSPSNDSEKKA